MCYKNDWCALSEAMFTCNAPLVVEYKLYNQFMYS